MRDYLISRQAELVLVFAATTSVSWPRGDAEVFSVENGRSVASPAFVAHVSQLSNWTLDPIALASCPDLAGRAKFRHF